MSNASITSALADLFSQVSAVAGLATVYDHEPTNPLDKSASIVWTGMDPDFFRFTVRVYVKHTDARDAQHALYTLCQSIDAALTSQFGPSEWLVTYNPENQVLMGALSTTAGRED